MARETETEASDLTEFGKSRRKFIQNAASYAFLAPLVYSSGQFYEPFQANPEKYTYSVFGLHDTPLVGGSVNVDELISDLQILGARNVVFLDPKAPLLEKVQSAGITPVIRWYNSINRYEKDGFEVLLGGASESRGSNQVQPYNEVDLPGEFHRDASVHIKEDFAPAAKHAADNGFKSLLTPVSQDANRPDYGYRYMHDQFKELKKQFDITWITENVLIGLHNYIFSPGENFWQRVINIHELAFDVFGKHLPIAITEAGLYQTQKRQYPRSKVAEETVRILTSRIPTQLKVTSVCFWILSNYVQRPEKQHDPNDPELNNFEVAAWRSMEGVREEYKAVQDFMDSVRE